MTRRNVYSTPDELRIALGLEPLHTPVTSSTPIGDTMTQPEARLGAQIRKACAARGAFIFKIHGGPTMMAGLPDLIACYRGIFLGIEVKMPGNKPSPIQRRRHDEINAANGAVIVAYSVSEVMTCLDALDAELDSLDAQ